MRLQLPLIAGSSRKALWVAVAFSILLLLFRCARTGSWQYAFLLWNLFLAWVPYYITWMMQRLNSRRWALALWAPVFGLWLLYLPNAPYIITDLYHLPEGGAPMWFDLILILSFAWTGMLLGFISIKEMQAMFLRRFPKWPVQLFILPVMLLCGWGVYIGRYLRWNSWDLVVQPVPLLRETGAMVLHPMEYSHVWGFTLCMGLFMHILYHMKFAAQK